MLVAFALHACAGPERILGRASNLPDHAQPRIRIHKPGTLVSGDAIRYRLLTRDDFQAKSPPAEVEAHAKQLGAFTCANVVPGPPVRVEVEPDLDSRRYTVKPANMSYHAEMDRSCSWWNDATHPFPDAYILEHEQIHFAIVELGAREADRRAKALVGAGASPRAAVKDYEQRNQNLIREVALEVLERQSRFDQDTSGRYAPEAQRRWWKKVSAELGLPAESN